LLSNIIIVLHLVNNANLNYTNNSLSVLNIARINESKEEDILKGLGKELCDPLANNQENAGL
jgi:hypothetical protein